MVKRPRLRVISGGAGVRPPPSAGGRGSWCSTAACWMPAPDASPAEAMESGWGARRLMTQSQLRTVETRLVARRRLADDVRLRAEVESRDLSVADPDGPDTIAELFMRSLDRLEVVSLEPAVRQRGKEA